MPVTHVRQEVFATLKSPPKEETEEYKSKYYPCGGLKPAGTLDQVVPEKKKFGQPQPPIPDDLIYPILDKEGKEIPVIDIGANLTKLCFKDNIREVLRRAYIGGITHIIITGTNYNSSKDALQICHNYDGIEGITLRSTIGIHPLDSEYTMTGNKAKYAKSFGDSLERLLLTEEGKQYCVAIGECGLDYSKEGYNTSYQEHVFRKQLSLAKRHHLPVFCHSRHSHKDFLAILKEYLPHVKAVAHCHSDPSIANLKELLEAGVYIGITGMCSDLRQGRFNSEILNEIPLDKLMVETDAPFLFPRNLYEKEWLNHEDRYKWLNEPCMVGYVIDRIRQVRKQESEAEIATETTAVAKKFFAL
jgi:TatD DNase family protein